MPHLTIGKLAQRTGVSTDTLRYYEKMDILKAGNRTASGYRMYHYDAVRVVRFIRSAQALHFSLAEIKGLLSLSSSDPGKCKHILKSTEVKIQEAQTRVRELQGIRKALATFLDKPAGAKNSVVDHMNRHTHYLSLGVAALLSCLPDIAMACAARCLYEDKAVRVEEPLDEGRKLALVPAC